VTAIKPRGQDLTDDLEMGQQVEVYEEEKFQ